MKAKDSVDCGRRGHDLLDLPSACDMQSSSWRRRFRALHVCRTSGPGQRGPSSLSKMVPRSPLFLENVPSFG